MNRLAAIALSALFLLGPAAAAEQEKAPATATGEEETETEPGPPPPGEAAGTIELLAVRDGERLIPKAGGPLRFYAIRAPWPPVGRSPGHWPPVELLSRRIGDLAAEGLVVYPAGRRDRYGNRLVNLYSKTEGAWLAEALAGEGLALVAPEVLFDPAYARLVAAEREARAAGLGIWSNPAHKVLCADDAWDGIDQLRVVQGRIREAAVASGDLYLNFGADWRRDFTLRLKAGRGARQKEKLELAADLEGRLIEVRGWIFYRGGPMIGLDNLGQIALVPPAEARC